MKTPAILAALLATCVGGGGGGNPPPPIDTAPRIEATTTPGAITFGRTYRVSWTDDGAGAVDSLIVRDSLAGQPAQEQRIARPTSPAAVTFTWPNPAPGQTVAGRVTAQTKRRQLASAVTSLAWSYTEVDTPPPPPVIDTSLVLSAIDIKPDTVVLSAGGTFDERTAQFCAFIIFGDGKVPADLSAPAECQAKYSGWFSMVQRSISPAQRARADSIYAGIGLDGAPSDGLTMPQRLARAATATRWMKYAFPLAPPAGGPPGSRLGQ